MDGLMVAVGVGAVALGTAHAGTDSAPVCLADCCGHAASVDTAREGARQMIEAQTFWALPEEHRATIAARLEAMGEAVPGQPVNELAPELAERAIPLTPEEFEAAFAQVQAFTDREAFASFSPIHQRMLVNLYDIVQDPDWVPAMPCFTPGVDFRVIEAFDEVVTFGFSQLQANDLARFEQIARWTSTALDPGGGGQGNPTTLTYSFPDDGAFIPSGVGEPAGPNALNAFMDGIYGDRETWRAIYDQIFQRWGDLSGNTYILEPNDDNSTLFDNAGVSGVRGDLRMAGKPIDGNSGTLAYNFFPNNGDMVIDTNDNFYLNTSGNSLRLRNILLHEHGHGMGQLHTCPITQSKLMEPFISLAFDGPQFDDILNAQRHYGDPLEPNDFVSNATDLGAFGVGDSNTVDLVSIDDDADVDLYEITITEAVEATVTLRPQGFLYQAGPQTSNCNENQPYNPLLFLDPVVAVLASDGSTVIASANEFGAGSNESVVISLTPGTYFVRASGISPTGDQIIAYELDLDFDFDSFSISLAGIPESVPPGVPTDFTVEAFEGLESLASAPVASIDLGGPGPIQQTLTNIGGNIWQGTIPAVQCDTPVAITVTAEGTVSGIRTFPTSGAVGVAVSDGIATVFNDNGETNLGYGVAGDASDGQWSLGVPANNGRGDPPADFDGSGSCWLTDNNLADDNSDVDNGQVVLTSPTIEIGPGTVVTYAYWFNDIPNGAIQGGDAFTVQISTNGGSTYTTVREVVTVSDNWRTDALVEGVDFVAAPSTQGRLRFIASDIGEQNVIEAGVDAIEVVVPTCTDACSPADLALPFGVLDQADIAAFEADFNALGPNSDFNGDGFSDYFDWAAFFAVFDFGCP